MTSHSRNNCLTQFQTLTLRFGDVTGSVQSMQVAILYKNHYCDPSHEQLWQAIAPK